MSYLEDVKNALRVIDNLCKEALKEPESLEGYIDEIRIKQTKRIPLWNF
ncbi:hypothetical protein [Neisseria gonorrhoeae]|nr:hypothetical protein [Neisseria gonorrhoeae]UYP51106.1 hypothetical protein ND436_006475 [Neisseria gonorrhoeae]